MLYEQISISPQPRGTEGPNAILAQTALVAESLGGGLETAWKKQRFLTQSRIGQILLIRAPTACRVANHHLICRTCGRMVDVDCAVGTTPCLTAVDDSGYEIDEAEVVYWGRCPECLAATSVSAGE
jgi:hypothetical protein